MADFSYNPNAMTDRDKVRLYAGDTDSASPIFTDTEIDFFLTNQGNNVLMASADALEAAASKLSRSSTSVRVGDISEDKSKIIDHLLKQAAILRARAGRLAEVVFGGVFRADKESLDEDLDLVQPSFRVGMDDHPGSLNEREAVPDDLFPINEG